MHSASYLRQDQLLPIGAVGRKIEANPDPQDPEVTNLCRELSRQESSSTARSGSGVASDAFAFDFIRLIEGTSK